MAGGAVAQQVFKKLVPGLEILAYVSQVHDLVAPTKLADITFKEIEGNIVRWPDARDAERGDRAD